MDIVLSRLGGNPVLVGAVTALFLGHRLIAQQYANRGMCSAFRITIYPWEAQGYDGYRC
jgi:hypothetical protein